MNLYDLFRSIVQQEELGLNIEVDSHIEKNIGQEIDMDMNFELLELDIYLNMSMAVHFGYFD